MLKENGRRPHLNTHSNAPSTSLLLPEAGYSRQVRACNNAGAVHVVQGPLVADGGREVAPLFFVDHEASDAKESDEHQDEKDQYRWRPCGPWSTHTCNQWEVWEGNAELQPAALSTRHSIQTPSTVTFSTERSKGHDAGPHLSDFSFPLNRSCATHLLRFCRPLDCRRFYSWRNSTFLRLPSSWWGIAACCQSLRPQTSISSKPELSHPARILVFLQENSDIDYPRFDLLPYVLKWRRYLGCPDSCQATCGWW